MTLQIFAYPHASYDEAERAGYLAYYYPYDATRTGAMTKSQWNSSYSPEILDYKEGRDEHIEYFVEPVAALITHALALENAESCVLVPAPSSIAWNDGAFSRVPRDKSQPSPRNRDDRNELLCKVLAAANTRLQAPPPCLRRVISKPPKATWTAEQHRDSLTASQRLKTYQSSPIVVVDDVKTNGGTLAGCALAMRIVVPSATIIQIAIGLAQDPAKFASIHGGT